jgi:hypothetical protein
MSITGSSDACAGTGIPATAIIPAEAIKKIIWFRPMLFMWWILMQWRLKHARQGGREKALHPFACDQK